MYQRIDATTYCDFFPSTNHGPGDIWSSLPSFGTLPEPLVSAIVVTPACDLSNRKVETITYLPIIPIGEYFSSRGFLPDIRRVIAGQLQTAGLSNMIDLGDGFVSPHRDDLTAFTGLINEFLAKDNLGVREKTAARRAAAGLNFISNTVKETQIDSANLLVELLQDKEFDQTLGRLIKNGRTDTHFLPCDLQNAEWSGVPAHSLALFRYPLSIPLELLDEAQNVTDEQWPASIQRLRGQIPCIDSITSRPIKRLRMQPRFLTDLITRFTGMFGRIGSPDFSEETVLRYTAEMRAV